MLIVGGDITNDVSSIFYVFFNVCLHSRSSPLRADWRTSCSSVDGEPQGNWIWNSSSREVVASSFSFSRRRACSQAILISELTDFCPFSRLACPLKFTI